MPKCQLCGKQFANVFGLKIHTGRLHKGKSGQAKAATGATTCRICGRKFNLPMHLGRHMRFAHPVAKHAKAPRRLAGRRGRRLPTAPAGLDVAGLTIDQLLGLKHAVDTRLADLAEKIRQAKVV